MMVILPEGEKFRNFNEQFETEDPPPPYTEEDDQGSQEISVSGYLTDAKGSAPFQCSGGSLQPPRTTSETQSLYPWGGEAATSPTAPTILLTPPGSSSLSPNSAGSSFSGAGDYHGFMAVANASLDSPLHPNYKPSAYFEPPSSHSSSHPSTSDVEIDGEREQVYFGRSGHHWEAPVSWDRTPFSGLSYDSFPNLCLVSHTWRLENGFPELPPPCQIEPHPFATHDITEEDWIRFLADIKKGASLSKKQNITAKVVPIVTPAPIVGRYYVAKYLQKSMLRKNRSVAGDVVDHWNEFFFHPRQMDVVLAQEDDRLSSTEGQTPAVSADHERMANSLRRRLSSMSFRSSGSSDALASPSSPNGRESGHDTHISEEELKERRKQEKESARKRNLEDKAKRKEAKEAPYQLFIQPH
ncbi:hypothetical protein BJ138DRAFT_1147962 [Hygrophoropsis aurantiaca]|uniref:Uncharacterized protein n=1 Tax=Hygrophoropsis aurantiaca TaxID=72124 RepID=A0ACB8AHQ4_9AGAM|nr:hypothetical protein BJ138DRAFT_1147962 [Hygrophoropsis aurantiaca]